MITLEQKNHYLKHQVAVLQDMLDTYEPTEENVKCDKDSPMFEDSCRFAGLYHSIFELVHTMKSMIMYNDIIINFEKKELR